SLCRCSERGRSRPTHEPRAGGAGALRARHPDRARRGDPSRSHRDVSRHRGGTCGRRGIGIGRSRRRHHGPACRRNRRARARRARATVLDERAGTGSPRRRPDRRSRRRAGGRGSTTHRGDRPGRNTGRSASGTTSVTISNEQGTTWTCGFSPFNGDVNSLSFGPVYEELVFVNGLKSGATTNWLASSYKWGNGNKTLTFTIRSGV